MRNRNRWFISLVVVLCGGGIVHAQQVTRVTLIAQRVTNRGKSPVEAVVAHCILPTSNRYQDVSDLQFDPAPELTQIDGEGQQVISVPLGTLGPGRTRSVRIVAWVRFKSVAVPLRKKDVDLLPLVEPVREGCLSDAWPLQLEKVRPVAEKIIERKARDIDKARAFYDHMVEHCRYDIDTKADSADVVLAGKPGSCSELAFAYIALCRSVGIPARLVTAYVNRQENAPSADWRTHAWAEFYADGVGWVPVDPTNRINRPFQSYFTRQDARYLTVLDDGVPLIKPPDPACHVVYVTADSPGLTLAIRRSAAWHVSVNRADEAKFFTSACQALRDADQDVRLDAVRKWSQRRHPLSMAFMLEAMFDAAPAVRRQGAQGIGRSGDVSVMIPLMDLLDVETDDAVAQAIVDAARQLLDVPDDDRRAIAVGELAKSRHDEALKLLADVWDDEAREVRKKAALMLYKFGDKPGVHKGYRRLVKDDDAYIRHLAARRWSRTGARHALALLVDYLESDVRVERERALAELKKHVKDDFGFNPRTRPTTRRNRQGIDTFRQWLREYRPDTDEP